jgi:CheY-like chemotaxis protein
LIVDDEETVRCLLRVVFQEAGFAVWTAATGWEACDLLERHKSVITYVLLDVCMPGLDGPSTLEAMRRSVPGVNACFVTGSAGSFSREDLRARGVRGVIAKPFDVNTVVESVLDLFRGSNNVVESRPMQPRIRGGLPL